MNIQERIEALETEFAEKIKTLKAEGQEFPKDYDEYWYIDNDGDVLNDEWGGFSSEIAMLEIGNVYKTKQQAEFAAEKLKIEADLRKFSRPFKYGDWNFEILWNNHENNIELDWSGYVVRQSVIYFESGEIAEKAIESVGKERIKKYIFGVED